MSSYPKDQHGEYQCLHTFIDVQPCHRGGRNCAQHEVRRYADGSLRVVSGDVIYSNESSTATASMMKIFASANYALECATKAPK